MGRRLLGRARPQGARRLRWARVARRGHWRSRGDHRRDPARVDPRRYGDSRRRGRHGHHLPVKHRRRVRVHPEGLGRTLRHVRHGTAGREAAGDPHEAAGAARDHLRGRRRLRRVPALARGRGAGRRGVAHEEPGRARGQGRGARARRDGEHHLHVGHDGEPEGRGAHQLGVGLRGRRRSSRSSSSSPRT